MQAQLPPIDYEAAASEKFKEYNTYDEHGDFVACTCTFREVITYDDEESNNNNQQQQQQQLQSNGHDERKLNINGDINKPDDSDIDDDDDDETDDFCAVEDVELSPPPQLKSAVKSIFDPEYDANENLIEEMVRRKPRNDIPKVIEVKIEKDTVKSSRIESMLPVPESIQQTERVPIINYVCDEDSMCPARAHFQRDPVTHDDVERLHNKFLDGVNGNLNGILEEKQSHDYTRDSENIDYEKNQLWKRVVPRYNFLTLDKVPKTFDNNIPFSAPPSPPPPPKTKDEKVSSNGTHLDIDDDENKFSSWKNHRDIEFREWHEVMNVRSYNDEVLTILPYVVID